MPVPDGLDGMRVDAGLARLLGLSRTVAATLAEEGSVLVDHGAVGKSDRLAAGSWLEVTLPEPARELTIEAEPVEGMEILYADDDIVAVDKPVGVAAHASVGWTGPTVIGGLAAAGFRISTSGAHERQGIVHRLDVGTSGVMVVATSERAYTVLKRAFKARTIDKRYHALVQGHVHLETGRTHQIRVHFSALRHPCCGDLTYGADPRLAERLGLERQWLHARSLGFAHPSDGRWVEIESKYPADLEHALEVLRKA